MFIAVELPEIVKGALGDIQTALQKSGADAKWVSPENIHLTIKFLGSVETGKIKAIADILHKTFAKTKAFPVTLSRLGAFPQMHAPRVLWAGLDDTTHTLKDNALQLDSALSQIGLPKEARAFRAHLTLARLRTPRNKATLIEEMNKAQNDFRKILFNIDNVTLFESKLSPKGPAYSIISQIKFL